MFTESTVDPKATIRARDVIIPSLMILAQAKRLGMDGLGSREIQKALEPAMVMSEKDRERLPDRTSRFSRTVRNALVSHQMLERAGFAVSTKEAGSGRTKLEITEAGQVYFFDHMLPMFQGALPPIENLFMKEPTPLAVEGAPPVRARDLQDVSLLALALAEAVNGRPVSPTEVRRVAKGLPTLQVSPEDLEPLPSHKPGRLDRTLRNITSSHNSLVRAGHAKKSEQGLSITPAGKVHLLNSYLLSILPTPPSLEEARMSQEAVPARKVAPRV